MEQAEKVKQSVLTGLSNMGTFFDRLWIFSGLLLASSEVLGKYFLFHSIIFTFPPPFYKTFSILGCVCRLNINYTYVVSCVFNK